MERQSELRRDGRLPWLRPDAKSQVTMRYVDGKPRFDRHGRAVDAASPRTSRTKQIEKRSSRRSSSRCCRRTWSRATINYLVNPTGRFVVGGPQGDCGLTGRKIIVDTYGGAAHHGGGAFSGKDPSKVDRSAAYAARYVAKNIVAAGLAEQMRGAGVLRHRRGEAHQRHGHHVRHRQDLRREASASWSPSISTCVRKGIIQMLDLLRPIYEKTAAYGHFGRDEPEFTWENMDKVEALKAEAGLKQTAAA